MKKSFKNVANQSTKNNFYKKEKTAMKKILMTKLVATELSEEETANILDEQSKMTVNTHERVITDLATERNKKDLKYNHKLQAEFSAEAHYKSFKAPEATAKDGMLLFDKCIVEDTLPGAKFKVNVGGKIIMCYLNGKLRQNKIKIGKGDEVRVEVSVYGLNEGRITWRF